MLGLRGALKYALLQHGKAFAIKHKRHKLPEMHDLLVRYVLAAEDSRNAHSGGGHQLAIHERQLDRRVAWEKVATELRDVLTRKES